MTIYKNPNKLIDVNIIGELAKNNFVFSGFNADKYLQLPDFFQPVLGDSWSITVQFKTKSDFTSSNYLTIFDTTKTSTSGITILIKNGKMLYSIGDGSWYIDNAGNNSIAANTSYLIKLTFNPNNSNYKFELSADSGATWVTDLEKTVTGKTVVNQMNPVIGKSFRVTSNNAFIDTCDISKCSIYLNGALWWEGTKYQKIINLYKNSQTIKEVYKAETIYYKHTAWTQTSLTADGVVGGSKNAARASSNYTNHNPWKPFDGGTSLGVDDCWEALTRDLNQWVEYYSPNPLKISKINFKNRGVYTTTYSVWKLSGSNDGINYEDIQEFNTGSFSNEAAWSIDITTTKDYKYLRLSAGTNAAFQGDSGAKPAFGKIVFEGTQLITTTSTDSEFSKLETLLVYKFNPMTFTIPGTYTKELSAGTYLITIVGGGGGSSTSPGGAGGGAVVRTSLPAGIYTIHLGAGGAGAVAYARNNNGKPGGLTSISLGDTISLVANGGTPGYGRRNGGAVGTVGDITVTGVTYTIVNRNTAGEESTLSFITNDQEGAGAAGTSVGDKSAGIAGNDGYIKLIRI